MSVFLHRHCSINHPSWAELTQFVRFLYVQLNDCQSSIYCDQEFFGKGTDFKTFVVNFMIRMSRVCYYNDNYVYNLVFAFLLLILTAIKILSCQYFLVNSIMKFMCIVWLNLCSKDFAMRSLKIVEDGNTDTDVVSQYQVKKEQEWDKRYVY